MALLPSGERYEYVARIGEGTFGEVHKARDTHTGEVVAIKKVRLRDVDSGGKLIAPPPYPLPTPRPLRVCVAEIPNTALREMRALQELHHPNVVRILGVFAQGSSLAIVFDCMACDLGHVIRNTPRLLMEAEVKCVMWMLLQGVAFCHANAIIHRVRSLPLAESCFLALRYV